MYIWSTVKLQQNSVSFTDIELEFGVVVDESHPQLTLRALTSGAGWVKNYDSNWWSQSILSVNKIFHEALGEF